MDWRLGSVVRAVVSKPFIGTGTRVTFPSNQSRVGLTVCPNADGAIIVEWPEFSASGDDGWFIANSSPALHITMPTHGELPTKSFTVYSVDSDQNVQVVEYLMPIEYLNQAIEAFRREYGMP